MAKLIALTNGRHAVVDDHNFEALNKYKWACAKIGNHYYAYRRIYLGNRKCKTILMHREVIGAKAGEIVDHIDLDALDNRESNLRICNRAGNARNCKQSKLNTSGFRGVYRHSQNGNWVAQLTVNMKVIYVGVFDTPEEAARERDRAAIKYHGEFARLNFP